MAGHVVEGLFDGLEHDGYKYYCKYLEPPEPEQIKIRDKEFADLNLLDYQVRKHCLLSSYYIQYRQCLEQKQFRSNIS